VYNTTSYKVFYFQFLIRIPIPIIRCFFLQPKNVITWRTVVFYLKHTKILIFLKLSVHNITLRNSHRHLTVRWNTLASFLVQISSIWTSVPLEYPNISVFIRAIHQLCLYSVQVCEVLPFSLIEAGDRGKCLVCLAELVTVQLTINKGQRKPREMQTHRK
jgi:hypothetical protein